MIYVVLDNIRSGNNIGSIFRTCDAFAISKLWLCGITASPPNKEILKTALGATDSVSWEHTKNVIELVHKLKKDGFCVLSIEQHEKSTPLSDYKPSKSEKYALILGNEVEGISAEILSLCNGILEIPQFGSKKSLNVAVAAGVALWHFRSNLK